MQPPRPPEGVLADGVVSLRVPSAVLAAALEIIDRDGADALSMRRLARALARDPMILYRHAPGKAALLNGVAETVLALLTRAGFSGPDALHIYRAVFGFVHGHILDELQELTVSPDETDDLLRLGLHRLAVGDFPCSAAWPPSWPPTTAPPKGRSQSRAMPGRLCRGRARSPGLRLPGPPGGHPESGGKSFLESDC